MLSLLKATTAAAGIVACVAGAAAADAHAQLSGALSIFSDMANPAPRAVMEGLVADFGALHPDLDIELTIIDREAYKTQIRNFLSANPPDVANWYAANRMTPYVNAGLFEDVSDLWDDPEIAANLASTKGAMTLDGKQWGVPYTYYQWGVYYRKDIYEELGLSEPANFDEMKSNCEAIIASGRKCYTIGTKFLWTAGGWFDYLNMRTHGFDFHMALARGEVSWTDDRVRQTFANWRALLDMGAFVDNHQTYSWQESLPFIVNGEAAAILKGNFAVAPLREAGLDDTKLDFYQFPEITPGVALAEDAPTDTFHIPSGAENKEAARAFLKFVVSANVQTEINSGAALGQLPVNAQSSVDNDKFLNEGFEMLSENSPGGVAQFFDRDFPAEMAAEAMQGFQEFMVFPDNLDGILNRLAKVQERVYRCHAWLRPGGTAYPGCGAILSGPKLAGPGPRNGLRPDTGARCRRRRAQAKDGLPAPPLATASGNGRRLTRARRHISAGRRRCPRRPKTPPVPAVRRPADPWAANVPAAPWAAHRLRHPLGGPSSPPFLGGPIARSTRDDHSRPDPNRAQDRHHGLVQSH